MICQIEENIDSKYGNNCIEDILLLGKIEGLRLCRPIKGKYNPTLNLCIKIANTLDKTLNDLFWDENKK